MKRIWGTAFTAAALLGFVGCTGSKIQEGMPKDTGYKPPMEMPNMAPGKGAKPLADYNKAMQGGGTGKTEKADAKGS